MQSGQHTDPWLCLACNFAYNAQTLDRCVGCGSVKNAVADITFSEAFPLWCAERGQSADSFMREAMATAWDLFLTDSPAIVAAAAGQQSTTLQNAFLLLDNMSLQAEYNQKLSAAVATAGVPASTVIANASGIAKEAPQTPARCVTVASPLFTPPAVGVLHPALGAVASKLSQSELARIQRVIDTANRRIETLIHRLNAMEASFTISTPALYPMPSLSSDEDASSASPSEPGQSTAEGLAHMRASWDEEDARDLAEVERRLEQEDQLARKQAIDSAAALKESIPSSDLLASSSSDASLPSAVQRLHPHTATSVTSTLSETSPANWSVASAGLSIVTVPQVQQLPLMPPDPLASVLLNSLRALGPHMSTKGVTLAHIKADLKAQTPSTDIKALLTSSSNSRTAWTALMHDGFTYEATDEEHYLPTVPDSKETPSQRALCAVILSLLEQQAPRCIYITALAGLVREAVPDFVMPAAAIAAAAAAPGGPSAAALAGAESTGGVWGCGCSCGTAHGANCSHSMLRSRPPPQTELEFEQRIADALTQLQDQQLVEQPVARNFRAVTLAK